jgi:anionic cell wall polymer biosynthesis LytR-Cps2A-Psr (LCP) family protein
MNLLIVGTDTREPGGEARTDTIMLAHVTKERDHVYLSSIARDTWVPIPRHGQSKINAAHPLGGAPLLVEELISAVIDRATSAGILTDPAALNAFLQSTTTAITVDRQFDLTKTAFALRDLRSDAMTYLTSPNKGVGTVGKESVVLPDPVGAAELYSSYTSDTVAQYLAR